MVSWGLWTVLASLSTRTILPETSMILSYGAATVIALVYVIVVKQPGSLPIRGVTFALGSGVFAGVGAIAFYVGLSTGEVSTVTAVSALYFVVAAVIGLVVLGDPLEWTDIASIGFAVAAVVFLSL